MVSKFLVSADIIERMNLACEDLERTGARVLEGYEVGCRLEVVRNKLRSFLSLPPAVVNGARNALDSLSVRDLHFAKSDLLADCALLLADDVQFRTSLLGDGVSSQWSGHEFIRASTVRSLQKSDKEIGEKYPMSGVHMIHDAIYLVASAIYGGRGANRDIEHALYLVVRCM